MKNCGLVRRGDYLSGRYSRWGATRVSEYGEGYQAPPIASYIFCQETTSGTVHYVTGIITTVSAMVGSFVYNAGAQATVTVTSGMSGTATGLSFVSGVISAISGASAGLSLRNAVTGTITATSGASATISYWQAVSGIITAVSALAGEMVQRYAIGGVVQAVSDATGDVTFIPGTTFIYGTITATSRLFELFRFLNPQTGYSPITEGLLFDSDMSSAVSGASAISTAGGWASGIISGFVYHSPISTGVDR